MDPVLVNYAQQASQSSPLTAMAPRVCAQPCLCVCATNCVTVYKVLRLAPCPYEDQPVLIIAK